MDAKLLFLHALSPLHAGTGQGVGVIDLPIAREKATNLPYVPGSSLKGVLRDSCADDAKRKFVFGPDTAHADESAGAGQFTDQRLLLFPVRSLRGTFAWVTCPLVLRRFLRDAAMAQANPFAKISAFPPAPKEDNCRVTGKSVIVDAARKVTLEDLRLSVEEPALPDDWARELGQALFPGDAGWQNVLAERLCLVSDDAFGFLVEMATEVVARIALEPETKTVRSTSLWYEEALPTETVLSGLVVASPPNGDAAEVFDTVGEIITAPLQVGGSATVGRGLCRLSMV